MESRSILFAVTAWTLTIIVYIGVCVTANGTYGYYPVTAYSSKICSKECKQWKPKQCWDGYLKRKVWKMVCESFEQKCCPGYEGPNCEQECINCEKIHGFERRFVDVYSKIQTLEATCSNITSDGSHTGGGGDETGGKITQCECPAGARGERGREGPLGPPGQPGPTGAQGPQGPPGMTGPEGPAGSRGLDGASGATGRDGRRGFPGERGEAGQQGEPGLPGMAGARGERGSPGADGLPGTAAEKGDPGPIGSQGPEGPRGIKGENGVRGLTGLNGYKGESGLDGRDGLDGRQGETGTVGPPGIPGADGRPGPRGHRGEPGLPGAVGREGSPGLPGRTGDTGLDGRPGDITKIEESTLIKEMMNTIYSLTRKLETTTNEVNELRVICDKIISCRFNCTADSYMCNCGMCIPRRYQCDGFPQCPDGSDEDPRTCDVFCSAVQFKCETTGMCIPLAQKCDGRPDCPDDSDESIKYCSTISCNEGDVPCRDGSKCVAREERCDGKADCTDGSDEEGCECEQDEFECKFGSPHCIPLTAMCDSAPHCEDQSDESFDICHSGMICIEGQRPCPDNSRCINTDQFCDKTHDCNDGSDEFNCDTTEAAAATTSTVASTTTGTTPTTSTTTATTPSTTSVITLTSPTTTTTTQKVLTTTTAKKIITTPEDELETGSGNEIVELTCQELYDNWIDPTFPGGSPPPLSPDETINEELCEFLRKQVLPNMADTRQKRHKMDDTTEEFVDTKFRDVEPEAEREAANIDDMSDIAFADSSEDESKPYMIEFAPKPAAVVAYNKNGAETNYMNCVCILVSSSVLLILHFM